MKEGKQMEEVRRIQSYLLKLTPREKKLLQQKANQMNLTVASLIRQFLINGITHDDLNL